MARVRVVFLAALALGCTETELIVPGGGDSPAAPRALDGWYWAGGVDLSWELGPGWDNDTFRVYGKRATDGDYFLLAEVTSCTDGVCTYRDVNVRESTHYDYYVAAVDPVSGRETASAQAIRVEVPSFSAPPAPAGLRGIGLDDATFLDWSSNARAADDFSFYRVYVEDGGGTLFPLGETDSEGFLDLLAENGSLYLYRVSSVDAWGHESGVSEAVAVSPRPDYSGELLYALADFADRAGFRFTGSELEDPGRSGFDPSRHFRVEEVGGAWWLAPGPEAFGVTEGTYTTALRCGPGADSGCLDIAVAPAAGYTTGLVDLIPEHSYVLRVRGDDGLVHYGVIRVALEGFDGEGRAVVVLDWAYQLIPDDPSLVSGG